MLAASTSTASTKPFVKASNSRQLASHRSTQNFAVSRRRVLQRTKAEIQTINEDRGASGIDINGYRPTSPKAWEIMSTALRSKNIKFITPNQIKKSGAKVIDVRPEFEYKDSRVPGSINIQFYRLIEGWDARRIARRATFAFFGILNGTEYNTNFIEQFTSAVPNKSSPITLYCNVGGTLDPTGPSEFGQQTRSLTAAYELIRAGYTNISVLKGGFYEYGKTEDVETDDE